MSTRRRLANQRNARRSTGPRTHAGKQRSSRNALKHGLAVSIAADPNASKQMHALAAAFAGPQGTDPVVYAHALRAAEAQLDLRRLAAVRAECTRLWFEKSRADLSEFPGPHRALYEHAKVDLETMRAFGRMKNLPPEYLKSETREQKAFRRTAPLIARSLGSALRVIDRIELRRRKENGAAVRQLQNDLIRLERYERRARSRRKTALRALLAAMKTRRPA